MESLADDQQLLTLCRKIERDRGFFCSSYKDTCLRRRISVRMRVKGASSFQQYSEILDADPLEYERLIATLTINVSKFFRNPETYATIAAKILPELAGAAAPVVRIWSAGCASGEEAYSLAVLCDQHVRAQAGVGPRFEITGTDVDADAIASARRARYAEAAFAETTPAVREMYFPISDGLHKSFSRDPPPGVVSESGPARHRATCYPREPDRLPERDHLFHATGAGVALRAVPRGVAAGRLPRPW